jgi:hypothetical protein
MKIKHFLSGLAIAAAATSSAFADNATCKDLPALQKQSSDLFALYGTLDNKAGQGRKPAIKADIAAVQAKMDAAKKDCDSKKPVAAAESCWWMESKPPYAWVKSPSPVADKAACEKLDSCAPTGGKASGGGCYIWAAVAPNAPAKPPKPEPIKGFTGAFEPSKWEVGNNTSRPIASVTAAGAVVGNDPNWASSGTTVAVKAPAAGTFEYTYSMSNGSANCPGAMGLAPNFKYVNNGGGTEKLKVAAGQSIVFAVNGKNQPSDFACKDAGGVTVSLRITNISFTFD